MTTLMNVVDTRAGVDAARRPGGFLAGLTRMLRRRAVYRELMSLDDRLLTDIGLTRGDVAAVAHQAAEEAMPCGMTTGTLSGALARLAERVLQNLRRRAAMAELMALDDRLLADIGLTRGQIPAAVGSTARIGWLKDEVESLVRPFRLWQRSIEASRTLHTLDDRALADAGMLRAEIGWVAAELAERSLTPANSNRLERAA